MKQSTQPERKKPTAGFAVAIVSLAAASAFAVQSCGSSASEKDLAVIAEKVKSGNDEMVVIRDISAVKKDPVIIDLAEWCEKLEIVPLDSRTEALFSYGGVIISDNYIGICSGNPVAFMLFDRKGKYLRHIGAEGRGPGEYSRISGAAIDEKNGRIYIMSWGASGILQFGIDGQIYPSIPFPVVDGQTYGVLKGHIRANGDRTFTVSGTPAGANDRVWIWRQDDEGNLIEKIGRLPQQHIDFSSESGLGQDTQSYEPFLLIYNKPYNDTLYRYETPSKKWIPRFTVSNMIETFNPPYYSYEELPGHFLGYFSPGMDKIDESMSVAQRPYHFFVDKRTLKGGYYDLVIDEIGGMGVWPSFADGHFTANIPALNFKEHIAQTLEKGGLDPKVKERLEKLDAEIDEEDNNILLLARLKK